MKDLRTFHRRARFPASPVGGSPRAVLIVFGTTEGHTRTLAEFMAAKLTGEGHRVTLRHAPDVERGISLALFEAIIVAASLHWGRYQNAVTEFAQQHCEALSAMPSAFVSASLSAVGVEQPERRTLADCVRTFEQETGWRPRALHHVGGGIRHSAYDYFQRLAAQLIAHQRGDRLGLSDDYDLTDYDALTKFVLRFVRGDPVTGRGSTPNLTT